MEVWSVKACEFCLGSQLNASKAVLLRWREEFFQALKKVTEEGYPEKLMDEVKARIGKEMEEYKPCSFCDGKGVFSKREKDATVEEASKEGFWEDSDGWLKEGK